VEPDPPRIFNATLSHFDFRTAPAIERAATGKGATDDEARLAAIAEAAERYCGWNGRSESFVRATFDELGSAAIPPTEFGLYSDSQYVRPGFPYRPFDPKRPIAWARGVELPDRKPVWLPAELVYLNFFEDLLVPPDSTGMAAGPDLESAILAGLYEAAERDAFTLMWLARLPAARAENAVSGPLEKSIIRHYARSSIEVRLYRLPSLIPIAVMMAMAIDESGAGPAAVVGLGCHLNPAIAARKALFEVCQVRPGVKSDAGSRLKSPADVRTLEDHAAYYASLERLIEFSFLASNESADLVDRSTGSVTGDISFCVEALGRAGCRTDYVEITAPELEDFPICVARVLVTGLQPIHFGFGMERLGGPRAPRKNLNPAPHPLA
jgi:ribosomal protein S12 methylthiotransferase accessory factor